MQTCVGPDTPFILREASDDKLLQMPTVRTADEGGQQKNFPVVERKGTVDPHPARGPFADDGRSPMVLQAGREHLAGPDSGLVDEACQRQIAAGAPDSAAV